MTFEEAVIKSVKAFYDGKTPQELLSVKPSKKFNKEYFDRLEEQVLGSKKSKKKGAKDGD